MVCMSTHETNISLTVSLAFWEIQSTLGLWFVSWWKAVHNDTLVLWH